MIRWIKILLALFVALFCLMYALQNLFNLQQGHGFVALMVGMEGHVAYPDHFGPAVQSSILVWLMLGLIIFLELLAGLSAAKGAFDLWRARTLDADTFNASKTWALVGCGLAVLIWFGIFSAIGGAYFQMWQTEAGRGPLTDAAWFSLQNGLAFLIIHARD